MGINDADYVVKVYKTISYEGGKRQREKVWVCPFHTKWTNMLQRCYSEGYQKRTPTYSGCFVCEEWLRFSNFKAWMEQQPWEGMELDKDILIKGNKVYSPDTCIFISRMVNAFVVERDASRGEHPIGVYWNKHSGKYMARCQNPFTNKYEYLGYFTDAQEAHKAWLTKKNELAFALAALQEDHRVADALRTRYVSY